MGREILFGIETCVHYAVWPVATIILHQRILFLPRGSILALPISMQYKQLQLHWSVKHRTTFYPGVPSHFSPQISNGSPLMKWTRKMCIVQNCAKWFLQVARMSNDCMRLQHLGAPFKSMSFPITISKHTIEGLSWEVDTSSIEV